MPGSTLTTQNITGVILAGGQSTRMGGGDKFLKKVRDKTILSFVIEKLEAQCDTIIISANGDPERLKQFNRPIIKDPIIQPPAIDAHYNKETSEKPKNENNIGPLAGILAAMKWTKENNPSHTHILSVAADSPLFPDSFTNKMIDHANSLNETAIILAKSGGWYHPIFGLWPIELATDLETQLQSGVRKIRAWTDTHANSAIEFDDLTIKDMTIDPFFNINKPEDFQTFERLATKLKE